MSHKVAFAQRLCEVPCGLQLHNPGRRTCRLLGHAVLGRLCGKLKHYRCHHKWPDQKETGWEKHLVHFFKRIKCFSATKKIKMRIRLIPEHSYPKIKCTEKSMFHCTSVKWEREISDWHWGLGPSVGWKPKMHRMKVRPLIFQQWKPAF